jgi:hypothetical protein
MEEACLYLERQIAEEGDSPYGGPYGAAVGRRKRYSSYFVEAYAASLS